MIDVKKSRFRDASWFEKMDKFVIPIIIGGVGGIGSWLALFLSRMLPPTSYIILYDFDKVEEVNMAGQLFRTQDIGKLKITAIKEIVKEFSGYERVTAMPDRYDQESLKSPVMFSCFDNMQARKDMFENWLTEAEKYPDSIFIDGRLNAEQFQVFYVTLEYAKQYRDKYLFSDAEVEDANCSYKQTTHFAAAIAAKMVQGFTGFLDETYELPFKYEEIGPLFFTEILNDAE
jgi:molybdopterin/thiamine biosynthesis adenylyltransferase